MSEPPAHTCYNLGYGGWGNEAASSSFAPAPQTHNYSFMHNLENFNPDELSSNDPPLSTDALANLGAIDWSSMIPLDGTGEWDFSLLELPPQSGESQGQGADADAGIDVSCGKGHCALGVEAAPFVLEHPISPILDTTGHQDRRVSTDALDLTSHLSQPARIPAAGITAVDPSAGDRCGATEDEPTSLTNVPAAASSHMERNPDKPVAPLRPRPVPGEEVKAAQKITAQLNREKNLRISADVLVLAAARDKAVVTLAAKHSVLPALINKLLGAPQIIKPQRDLNIANALFCRKALEYNAGKFVF